LNKIDEIIKRILQEHDLGKDPEALMSMGSWDKEMIKDSLKLSLRTIILRTGAALIRVIESKTEIYVLIFITDSKTEIETIATATMELARREIADENKQIDRAIELLKEFDLKNEIDLVSAMASLKRSEYNQPPESNG
jgi:hypothetical protein